jgi:hypothetical protein
VAARQAAADDAQQHDGVQVDVRTADVGSLNARVAGFIAFALRIRNERRADIHKAFFLLACSLICWSFAERSCLA